MEFDEEENDVEHLEDMLDELGLAEEGAQTEISKKDSTVFLIYCSPELLEVFEDEEKSQLQLVFEGYYNFLQRKIIANAGDKVGLILVNVANTHSSIGESHIFKVHELEKDVDAERIKDSNSLFNRFSERFGGISGNVPLSSALWEYGTELKTLSSAQYHLRLFLFTAEDCPHNPHSEHRQISITRARELAAKNVQIELFPLRKTKKCNFDLKKFYHEIITFDPDEINKTLLDTSSKILDLQERLRQKEFKKRTQSRLVMRIGKDEEKDVFIGVKLYNLFSKAKKPPAKKVEAKTNKLLERVTRKLNKNGEVLFDGAIGTFYPLGGEKVKITKEDLKKIKSIESPGITLVGFKPQHCIKPYHNIRSSYFLYPDEEHVSGSSQFCDALINELTEQNLVGIVKIVPRNHQELRFAALFPQQERYDEEEHFQVPPGFHLIILPFADDIVNFAGEKTKVPPAEVSTELIQITKLLINNLTIHDFDFRDFENPALQKFYSHLQAHALNEKAIVPRPDLLEPDVEGFQNYKDIIALVAETARIDAEMNRPGIQQSEEESCRPKATYKSKVKKESKVKVEQKNEVKREGEDSSDIITEVESIIMNGNMKELKVVKLRKYLEVNGLDTKGGKEILVDRILNFIEQKNTI